MNDSTHPVAWRYQYARLERDANKGLVSTPRWHFSGHNCKADLHADDVIEPLCLQTDLSAAKEVIKNLEREIEKLQQSRKS